LVSSLFFETHSTTLYNRRILLQSLCIYTTSRSSRQIFSRRRVPNMVALTFSHSRLHQILNSRIHPDNSSSDSCIGCCFPSKSPKLKMDGGHTAISTRGFTLRRPRLCYYIARNIRQEAPPCRSKLTQRRESLFIPCGYSIRMPTYRILPL